MGFLVYVVKAKQKQARMMYMRRDQMGGYYGPGSDSSGSDAHFHTALDQVPDLSTLPDFPGTLILSAVRI